MVGSGALQLISPLFLPPPQQVLAKLLLLPDLKDLWTPPCGSIWQPPDAHCAGATCGGVDRHSGRVAMGLSPTVRGILDPIIELYVRCRRWRICR